MKKTFLIALFIAPLFFGYRSLTVMAQEEAVSVDGQATKAAEQLDFANGLFQRELFEMAVNEYVKVAQDFPALPEAQDALFGIAESHFFAKDYPKAIDAYTKFISTYPNSERSFIASLRHGQSLFFTKKYKKAVDKFNTIDEGRLGESFLQVLYHYKGKAYRALDDIPSALEYLEKSAEAAKESLQTVESYHELAQMYKAKNNFKGAAEFYEKAYQSAETDQLRSISLYNKGEVLFQDKNFTEAEKSFRTVLDQFPESQVVVDAAANIILTLYNLSKYQEVVDVFQKNLSKISKTADYFNVYFVVINSYVQLDQNAEAVIFIDSILGVDSLKPEDKQKVLLKKSEILAKTSDFDGALKLIDQALETGSNKKDQALFIKAESLYGMKQYENALMFYQQIVTEFKDSPVYDDALFAIGHCLSALDKSSEAMEAFWMYVQNGKDDNHRREALYNEVLLSKKNQNIDRAIEHGEQYLNSYKGQDSDQTQTIMFSLGTFYSKKQQYDKTITVFKQFVEDYPESAQIQDVYFLIAYNLQLAEKFDEAISYYDKLTLQDEAKELYYSALKNKGLIYIGRGEEQKAANIFDQMIQGFSDNDLDLNTYLWLAKHFHEQKQYDKVLNVLDKAMINKTSEESLDAIAYYRAEAFKAKSQWQDASDEYQKVIGHQPSSQYKAAARIGRGLVLLEKKDYDGARKEFDAVLVEFPQDNTVALRARFGIASLEQSRGQIEEASKFYMLVAVLYDDSFYCPQALFQAGQIMEELQKKEQAKKLYQELLDRYPEHELTIKAKEKIGAVNVEG